MSNIKQRAAFAEQAKQEEKKAKSKKANAKKMNPVSRKGKNKFKY
jgi:hypothetical protein